MKQVDLKNVLNSITDIDLYTENRGKSGCLCNCSGCTQTNYGNRNIRNRHQGTLEQCQSILETFPNLKLVYILGNPDCCVDTEFCREVSKFFIAAGKNTAYTTSGIGGERTFKILFDGVDLSHIEYVSFSVDSINEKTSTALKGRHIPFSRILSGIEYCLSKGIPVKIQPTIWQENADDVEQILNFFYTVYGIKWYTFHAASLDGIPGNKSNVCHHVRPDKWRETMDRILKIAEKNKLKVNIPYAFLRADEYQEYIENKVNFEPWCRCKEPILEIKMEHELRASFCCILGESTPKEFSFNPIKDEFSNMNTSKCPAHSYLLGPELFSEFHEGKWISPNGEVFYPVCRFYGKQVGYQI